MFSFGGKKHTKNPNSPYGVAGGYRQNCISGKPLQIIKITLQSLVFHVVNKAQLNHSYLH